MFKIQYRKINDLAFNEFINILATKTYFINIDKFHPSSKTCNCCDYIKNKKDLKNLRDKIFNCSNCNTKIETDIIMLF